MNGGVSEVVTGWPKTGHHGNDHCDRSFQDHSIFVQSGHGATMEKPVIKIKLVTGVTGSENYQPSRARAHTHTHAQLGRTREPVTLVTPVTMINWRRSGCEATS